MKLMQAEASTFRSVLSHVQMPLSIMSTWSPAPTLSELTERRTCGVNRAASWIRAVLAVGDHDEHEFESGMLRLTSLHPVVYVPFSLDCDI